MANQSLGLYTVVILLLGSLINTADAEIHEYHDNKRFTKISNGLYVSGDSEAALYASKLHDVNAAASSSASHSNGKFIIRFDDISFVRTKEAASKQKSKLVT